MTSLSHCQTSESHSPTARGSIQKFDNDYDVIFLLGNYSLDLSKNFQTRLEVYSLLHDIKMATMMKKLQASQGQSSQKQQCAAYNCTSRLYKIEDGERKLTGINFFCFLKDQGEKQAWCNLIKRRNNMDGFQSYCHHRTL